MNTIDRMMYRNPERSRGFTLIEMMIVVAVISILTLIAYPSYVKSVREGRRSQAKSDLVTLANYMERCYTQSVPNSYAACTLSYNTTTINGTVFYNLAFNAAPTVTAFQINAVPAGDQVNDPCGTLSVDQAGNRLPLTSSNGGACF